jgi:hypothetical protein
VKYFVPDFRREYHLGDVSSEAPKAKWNYFLGERGFQESPQGRSLELGMGRNGTDRDGEVIRKRDAMRISWLAPRRARLRHYGVASGLVPSLTMLIYRE